MAEHDGSARFEVETVYLREEANSMRRHLADTPKSELARDYLNYYAKVDARISAERDPEIVDDVGRNVITVREAYKIPALWDDDEREFNAGLVEARLANPRISRRTMPLAIHHPDHVAQTIEVRLPEEHDIEDESKEIALSGFQFAFSVVKLEKKFTLRYEYRSLRDAVQAAEMDADPARLDEVKKVTGYSIATAALDQATGADGLEGRGVGARGHVPRPPWGRRRRSRRHPGTGLRSTASLPAAAKARVGRGSR